FVRIKSADPAEPPAIQPRYLSDPIDRDTVVAGLKLLRGIMGQPAMERYIAEERVPGPHVTSDADLLAFARSAGTTVFHPTSTCRMGADANAVVDERLRVRGIGNLRVVDASIMPTVVSGNANAAVVMIAEKGADMILQDAVAPMSAAVTGKETPFLSRSTALRSFFPGFPPKIHDAAPQWQTILS